MAASKQNTARFMWQKDEQWINNEQYILFYKIYIFRLRNFKGMQNKL